jgi:ribosomal protein L24
MKIINGVQVPNPHTTNPPKVGDKVKISSGEFAGMIGEVVEVSEDVKNLITKIKLIKEDNKIQYIETKAVILEAWDLVEKIAKSNLFKKVWNWIKNIFKKKKKS